MKKYFFIFCSILLALVILIICYFAISASNSVNIVDNYLNFQSDIDMEIDSYGYSIDNPLVINNPYGINPLSAMVVFQTDDYVSPKVIVKGKNNDDIIYNYNKAKIHHLPIYCLYANYSNEVVIMVNGISKTINIDTTNIDINDSNVKDINDKDTVITSIDNHLVIIDKFNNIRGYFLKKYSGNILYLNNGHFILSTYQINNDGNYMGIVEIDLLGKVYNQFIVPNGYHGLSTYDEDNNILYVLSNKLLAVDMQSWSIIKEYDIDDYNYSYLEYDNKLHRIVLASEDKIFVIGSDGVRDIIDSYEFNCDYLFFDNGITNFEYSLFGYKSYGLLDESIESKSISLLSYKKPDRIYNDLGLDFYFEDNRLVISSNEKIDNGYVILDKIFDKHTYALNDNYTVVNGTSLSGKYSIYIKIGNRVYKTNYYVIF